jgi:O-antigen chain-terminating methyltransferase
MELPTEAPIISHRSIIGRLIVAYKKFIKLLIAPYLRTVFEKEHQEMDAKLMAKTQDILMRTDSLFLMLDKKVENLSVREADDLRQLKDALRDMQGKVQQTEEKVVHQNRELQVVADLKQEFIVQKRRLDLILAELREKTQLNTESVKTIAAQKEHLFDRSYFLFENRFRGSREDIMKRQEIYLPILLETWERLKNRGGYVLDIGCGRGELLESLREKGIEARGVDSNNDMVRSCKERGLIVESADAITFLKGIKNDSLCGIFAAQFIEHLPVDVLTEFVRLCFDKLQKGGKLIFETLNPESFYAMKWFYLDLSHQKPVHPQAISFLLEANGFYNVEVRFMTPVPDFDKLDAAAQNLKKLNNFLFGFQEYAVIAER